MKKGIFVFLILFISLPLYAEFSKGKIGVDVNYPGLGVRYFFTDKISEGLKGQFEKDIGVYGLRGYYYFKPGEKLSLLSGLECDYVSFEGDESEGSGFAVELFVGGEYFFAKNISLQMDMGPAFIALNDKDTDESVGGVEYVVNIGINYYFGKGR